MKKSIRQRDTDSRILFTERLLEVLRDLASEQLGLNFNGEYLSTTRFADGIYLLSSARKQIQDVIIALHRETE